MHCHCSQLCILLILIDFTWIIFCFKHHVYKTQDESYKSSNNIDILCIILMLMCQIDFAGADFVLWFEC